MKTVIYFIIGLIIRLLFIPLLILILLLAMAILVPAGLDIFGSFLGAVGKKLIETKL